MVLWPNLGGASECKAVEWSAMLRLTELKLPLDHSEQALRASICSRLNVGTDELQGFEVVRRGHDARNKKNILFVYSLDVLLKDEKAVLTRLAGDRHIASSPDSAYRFVAHAPVGLRARPVIIGSGPCGFMAGLLLAQMGFKPLILERGKIVRQRTQDTWALWRKHKLNPESNVQFGEGGAGTFSDGKLHTQIKDPRFLVAKVLREFVKAGAPEEILYISKPHVGTFRLVGMLERIRNEIETLGGEFRFNSRVVDVDIQSHEIKGVVLDDGMYIASNHVILAIGHSARDTFKALHARGVYMEAKPFSMGLRIEHPQSLIDQCRFGPFAGHPDLGAADYKLVHHCKNGRSVYSFCMCPGGTVVAATSEVGQVVTNGMSQYSRNERNANSAIVVGVTPDDFPSSHPLAGLAMQRQWERRAFELGGGHYNAPGQLLGDFLDGRASQALGRVQPSYRPGVHLTDLSSALPEYVIEAIREALPAFDRKIKGFSMRDAVLTGVETRTSSPVRIKRDRTSLQSVNTKGLYPGGEGAGYAGGIMSAAVDGIELAEALALAMVKEHQALERG